MAVHYYLSKKIDRNGEAPIQVTISLKGVRLQTSVGHSIPASKWLAETERVRKGCTNSKGTSYSKINSDLAEIESSILKLENTGGLPPMAFAVSFRIREAEAKTAVKHHRPERTDGRFRIGAVVTVVPLPEGMMALYIYML